MPGTRLHRLTGATQLPVNSAHHQAVKDPAPGLVVDAVAPDGVIEGIEDPNRRFLVGVSQGVAAAWIGGRDGSTTRVVGWDVPSEPPKRGPSPGVRLARGPGGGSAVYVNALRTNAHEAAIFRIEKAALPGS